VACAARRFVVIASSDKVVEKLHPPVPLELLRFGAAHTLATLAPAEPRNVTISPDGNVIADYLGGVDDPGATASWLGSTPGVVEHGLFPPMLVDDVLVGLGSDVQWLRGSPR
jgi:ribose 5-phosphate isomerase A